MKHLSSLGVSNTQSVRILSMEELNCVAGGPLPLVPVIVGIIGGVAGYITARSTDDCTKTTTTWTDSANVTHMVEKTICT
jgi:hypothetical protein